MGLRCERKSLGQAPSLQQQGKTPEASQEEEVNSRTYTDWYGGARRQSWGTPSNIFDPLHELFDFTLDGASEPGNGLLPRSSTAKKPISWTGERVFCNPPWSNIPTFVELAAKADIAVLLVPSRVNSRWFHRALELGAVPCYFLRRPKFVGTSSSGHNSPVDCLLLVFRNGKPKPMKKRRNPVRKKR